MSKEWPVVTIDDIKSPKKHSIVIGPFGSRMKSDCYVDSGVPVIRGTNIGLTAAFVNDFVYITEEKADELLSCNAYQDDLVFPHRGSIGEVGIVDSSDRYVLSSSLMKLTCDIEKAAPKFIYYFFKSHLGRHELLKNASQVGTPGIGQPLTSLKSIELRLPPLRIQKSIAKILSDLDQKIQLNQQINQTLEEMAQALFKSWFVDFEPTKAKIAVLEAGGSEEDANLAAMQVISCKTTAELEQLKTQNPENYQQLHTTAQHFPAAMQDSELGEIPEGWEVSIIENEYQVVMGQSPKGDTYNEEKQGTLFYQGRAEFGWRFPSPRLYTTDPKRMANKGDTLMSVRAPVGDLNIALEDCCIGRGLAALRHTSDCPTFTYYQIKNIKKQLDCFNSEGTVFGSINQKDLKNLPVIKPNQEIISSFSRFSAHFDQLITAKAIEQLHLNSLRDELLPKLLSGKIKI